MWILLTQLNWNRTKWKCGQAVWSISTSGIAQIYESEKMNNSASAIKLKNPKGERISPFWVGEYQPFSVNA